MMMIKSNGGSGTFSHAVFRNFTGHSNAYTLNLDSAWAQRQPDPGLGVEYDYLTFSNWKGTCLDGTRRPPIQILCPDVLFCGHMEVEDFNVWTENGTSVLHKCQNAFGVGACMNQFAGNGAYVSTATVKTMDVA
jgi:rhamnogalacturonan hydrolase